MSRKRCGFTRRSELKLKTPRENSRGKAEYVYRGNKSKHEIIISDRLEGFAFYNIRPSLPLAHQMCLSPRIDPA